MCGRQDGCFSWELLDADFATTPGAVAFRWRLTNNCASALEHASFRFVPEGTVLTPVERSTYTAPSGRTYLVDAVGGSHPGADFMATGSRSLPPAESEIFALVVALDDLSPNTVLWNNAASQTGESGRMDMRSGLCFTIPSDLDFLAASACWKPLAAEQWQAQVRWTLGPHNPADAVDVFRLGGAGEPPVWIQTVPAGQQPQGGFRIEDRLPAGGASGYELQARAQDGRTVGEPVRLTLGTCPVPLDSSSTAGWVLQVLALGAAMVVVHLHRRRPASRRPS